MTGSRAGGHANEVDAGLTYLDHEPPTNMLTAPLHNEQYRLVVRRGTGFDDVDSVDWQQVAAMPLCLLHQGMQYRRILDGSRLAYFKDFIKDKETGNCRYEVLPDFIEQLKQLEVIFNKQTVFRVRLFALEKLQSDLSAWLLRADACGVAALHL